MTECRIAQAGEEFAQKLLWAAAFGDSKEYIDGFYNGLYSPERMALATEDGELAAMCALLPCRLCLPGGGDVPAVYLYALATDPARRGRGHARRLLAWVEGHLAARGTEAVVTVPAAPALHGFFAGAGYEAAFSRRVLQVSTARPGMEGEPYPAENPPAGRVPSSPLGLRGSAPGLCGCGAKRLTDLVPAEYAALRAGLLVGRPSVAYSEDYFAHWAKLGRLCRLESGGRAALAAVQLGEGDTVTVQELLASDSDEAWAVAALADELSAATLRVCLPPRGEGEDVPFGMLRPLAGLPPVRGGYLAFAMD